MTHFDPRAVFHAMCEASRAHKMPRAWRTDLTKHDRRFLREHDGSPFGWILYESGTHVMSRRRACERPDVCDGTARHFAEENTPSRFYAWDGAAFREVTPDEWIEILTDCHACMREHSGCADHGEDCHVAHTCGVTL